MRNAGLDEAEAGIKIAGRIINNLRYADDTTLMAESVLIAQQIFKVNSLVGTFIYSLRHPCWVSLQLSSFALSLSSNQHNPLPSRFMGAGISLPCSLLPTVGPRISFSEWSCWMPLHQAWVEEWPLASYSSWCMCVCVIFSTVLSKEILLILSCPVIIPPNFFYIFIECEEFMITNNFLKIIFANRW